MRGKLVIFSHVNFRNYLGETHELYKYLGPDLTQWDASYNDKAYYQVAEEDLNPPDYVPVTPSAPAQMPQKEPAVMPFTDIAASHYAKDAIQWAWENGYCDGVPAPEFAPDQGLSSAMLVTILWHMAETPHEISSGFRDVPDGKWYSEAIAWAASLDLVSGAAPGLFAPNTSSWLSSSGAMPVRRRRPPR